MPKHPPQKKKPKKKKKVKADLNSKIGKYYVNRHEKGMTKTDAQLEAGFADGMHATRIENTQTYQEIDRVYGDVLKEKISIEEIAEAHADNIRQEGSPRIDRSARNKAIEMAVDRMEPQNKREDDEERFIVVLRG